MSGGFQLTKLENDLREFLMLHDLGQNKWFDFAHFGCTVFVAEYFVDSSERSAQGGVEMIFNGIVSPMLWFKKIPSRDEFADIFPTVSPFLVSFENYLLLFLSPAFTVDFGIKMVVPPEIRDKIPLSALFSRPVELNFFCN